MNNNHEDLQGRVRTERKNRGWTQTEMAEKVGMSLRAYQMFETRKSMPQGQNLRTILRTLDMNFEGDEIAAVTRSEWPLHIQVFLDAMGAYLDTMTEDQQLEVIHDLTRQIFAGNRTLAPRGS